MSDDRSFDDVMADIAIRSATNGGPGIVDVLEAIRASHTETKRVLSAHFTEAKARDQRIADLEAASSSCPVILEQHKRDIIDAHRDFHSKYVDSLVVPLIGVARRKGDPEDANWESDRRTYLMWIIGSKIGYVALAVLVALIVMVGNYLVLGRP